MRIGRWHFVVSFTPSEVRVVRVLLLVIAVAAAALVIFRWQGHAGGPLVGPAARRVDPLPAGALAGPAGKASR